MACEKEFVRLHKACSIVGAVVFCNTSQQTVNVLALVELFPNDIEKQTALELHLQAEIRAKQDYECRRHDLFDFVEAKVKTLSKQGSFGNTAWRNVDRPVRVIEPKSQRSQRASSFVPY